MATRRMDMHRLQELVRLLRLETGHHKAAKLLAMSPNTERAYRRALEEAGLLAGEADVLPELATLKAAVTARLPLKQSAQCTSSVEPWRERVATLVRKGAGPKAIFDRFKLDDKDFDGSLQAIKRMVRSIRRGEPPKADDVVIRVETAPGQVAQVDFGYVGKLRHPDTGVRRKAWVFVMTLGYSRHMFADIVFDQRAVTWQRLHVAAFEHFKGVVATVVPDNLKAAVIRAAFGPRRGAVGEPQLPRDRAALRLQDRPRTAAAAEEEGQGRVGRRLRETKLLRDVRR